MAFLPIDINQNAIFYPIVFRSLKGLFQSGFFFQMNLAGLPLPLLNDIEKKKKEIEGARTYMYKDDDIEAVMFCNSNYNRVETVLRIYFFKHLSCFII